MKKIVIFLMILCMCGSVFTGCTSYQENDGEYIYNYDDVKDILIRFHVIANSDTDEDQNLKLKVRDKVIEYLYFISVRNFSTYCSPNSRYSKYWPLNDIYVVIRYIAIKAITSITLAFLPILNLLLSMFFSFFSGTDTFVLNFFEI